MKVGWILSSNKNAAGSRIHGWNMHEVLAKRDIPSQIIYFASKYNKQPNFSQEQVCKIINDKYDIIVVVGFKSEPPMIELIKIFKKNGVKVVYIKTDEISHDLVEISDATIMVTEFAKSELPKSLQNKVRVIFDGYEHDGDVCKSYTDTKSIKLIFISNNVYDSFPQIDKIPKNVSLRIIGPPRERVEKFTPGKKLFSETKYDYEYIVWDLNTVEENVLDCDVAVIPYPDKHLKADFIHRKSSNRLVLFMSYGIPTIASPTGEYERLIKNGENGFIAKTKEDWQKLIKNLRDDSELRKNIGLAGRKTVIDKYSKESQADEYLNLFNDVIHPPKTHSSSHGG